MVFGASETCFLNYLHISFVVIVLFQAVELVELQSCALSDAKLLKQRSALCDSLTQGTTSWCGKPSGRAKADWPSQAVYLNELVETLLAPETCLNTTKARNTVAWLNETQADPGIAGNFAWTWKVFQVQYYDMPRKPGSRIEAPDTLGRKCWAFAYLRQTWNPSRWGLVLAAAGLSASQFADLYATAVPATMRLCEEVMANCFLNTTYTPSRNGTCLGKIAKFHYLGFARENLKRGDPVHYPFSSSSLLDHDDRAVTSMTGTAQPPIGDIHEAFSVTAPQGGACQASPWVGPTSLFFATLEPDNLVSSSVPAGPIATAVD